MWELMHHRELRRYEERGQDIGEYQRWSGGDIFEVESPAELPWKSEKALNSVPDTVVDAEKNSAASRSTAVLSGPTAGVERCCISNSSL